MGVPVAVQPEFEGGLEMVRQALLRFGHEDERTRLLVEEQRELFYGMLKS
jgi:hypothetical protein